MRGLTEIQSILCKFKERLFYPDLTSVKYNGSFFTEVVYPSVRTSFLQSSRRLQAIFKFTRDK